jgi:cell division septum initiation protein DivIVA
MPATGFTEDASNIYQHRLMGAKQSLLRRLLQAWTDNTLSSTTISNLVRKGRAEHMQNRSDARVLLDALEEEGALHEVTASITAFP